MIKVVVAENYSAHPGSMLWIRV